MSCPDCVTRHVCITATLDDESLAKLKPQIVQRATQRGELIARQGEIDTHVHIVKMGTVFGLRRGLDGRTRPIGVARRGAAFGVLGAFGKPNLAGARAISAGRICEIPVEALRGLGANNPQFMDELAQSAVETCGATAAWSEAMRVPGVVNQLAYVLVLIAEALGTTVIELPPHTALAELVGTTRETIARSLATLESEGGIRRHERKHCEIHRKVLLARVARSSRDSGSR